MSLPAGRKKDPVWVYFTAIATASGKGVRAKCKRCDKEIQGIPTRLKAHHEMCQGPAVEMDSEGECEVQVSQPEPGPSTSRQLGTNPPPPKSKRPSSDSKIDSYFVKTSKKQKEELDEQAARLIYATNSAFRTVDHPEFIKYSQQLRPGYLPPNRHEVGGKLLEQVYQKEIDKCVDVLKDQCVCLSLDGWSNIRNEPIVCMCVVDRAGRVFLVDTVDTSGNSHTSDYLEEITLNCIKNTQEKFKCKIRSFVTDNAANMAKMRHELEKDDSVDVLTYGCSAHLLNLLAKDLTIRNVKDHIVAIVKYFRNTHLPKAWYTAAGGSALTLPQDVRWNTLCDCVETYIKNWSIMLKVCEDHRETIDSDIRNKVMNMGIKRNAEDLVARLKPIAVALDNIQKDNCTIAKAVDIWKSLEEKLGKVLDRSSMKMFTERYNQAITPAHCLAYLLSPSLTVSKNVLTEDETETALDFAATKYTNTFLPIVIKFKGRASPFQGRLFDESVIQSMSDMEWWQSFNSVKGALKESEMNVVEQLLTAVASSAGIERVFSTFGIVHSTLRNRLGVDKAAKLVFLMRILNSDSVSE